MPGLLPFFNDNDSESDDDGGGGDEKSPEERSSEREDVLIERARQVAYEDQQNRTKERDGKRAKGPTFSAANLRDGWNLDESGQLITDEQTLVQRMLNVAKNDKTVFPELISTVAGQVPHLSAEEEDRLPAVYKPLYHHYRESRGNEMRSIDPTESEGERLLQTTIAFLPLSGQVSLVPPGVDATRDAARSHLGAHAPGTVGHAASGAIERVMAWPGFRHFPNVGEGDVGGKWKANIGFPFTSWQATKARIAAAAFTENADWHGRFGNDWGRIIGADTRHSALRNSGQREVAPRGNK